MYVSIHQQAFPGWSDLTTKSRAAIMLRFHALLMAHTDELADIVVAENGKNKAEAIASVAKGAETVEWACSMPQLAQVMGVFHPVSQSLSQWDGVRCNRISYIRKQGRILQVSRGVTCFDHREPLGIVASIVPFNFPM